MKVLIRKSKTDQIGKGRIKPIIRGTDCCPVEAVQSWLRVSGITEGYLFRQVSNDDKLLPSSNNPEKTDLSGQMVALIVKKYAQCIGLDESLYSGHSLRRGFITSGVRKGKRIEKLIVITH
jgi:site-specific recombinase XerD